MEELLIEFDTAKLAKEKGFDKPVFAIYSGNQLGYVQEGEKLFRKWNHCKGATYSAPTQALLQRWLREEHNIDVYCIPILAVGISKSKKKWKSNFHAKNKMNNTYEIALEKGLQEALKLV